MLRRETSRDTAVSQFEPFTHQVSDRYTRKDKPNILFGLYKFVGRLGGRKVRLTNGGENFYGWVDE
jgi:hypothetical protein